MPGVEQTETQGGNLILLEGKNLHGNWDDVPETWAIEAMPGLLSRAKQVPATTGQTGILPAPGQAKPSGSPAMRFAT